MFSKSIYIDKNISLEEIDQTIDELQRIKQKIIEEKDKAPYQIGDIVCDMRSTKTNYNSYYQVIGFSFSFEDHRTNLPERTCYILRVLFSDGESFVNKEYDCGDQSWAIMNSGWLKRPDKKDLALFLVSSHRDERELAEYVLKSISCNNHLDL